MQRHRRLDNRTLLCQILDPASVPLSSVLSFTRHRVKTCDENVIYDDYNVVDDDDDDPGHIKV